MSKTSEILALYNEQDLKARLESILTKKFFMDISDLMEEEQDDDYVLDQLKLITAPLDILKDYLERCETQEEKITGYTIFLEIIIKISNETTKKDPCYFGLLTFIDVNQKVLDTIFGTTMDFLMAEIKIIFPDEDEEDQTFTVEADSFSGEIFDSLYGLLQSDNFLDYGGAYISDKFYELLNSTSSFED
jgi:hypothetical protein